MAGWKDDVLFTFRSMRRTPAFTATALLTLILGMGATTAIFSLVYAVLFRPLPFPNAGRLVHIVAGDPLDSRAGLPYSLFEALKGKTHMVEDVAAYYRNTGWSRVTLAAPLEPQTAQAGFVSAGFFRVLAVQPAIGRVFDPDEVDRAEPLAVLGDALWKQMGGQPDVLGKTIQVDDKPFNIIGVMPPEFQSPARETALWLPVSTNLYWGEPTYRDSLHARGFFMRWNLLARLRPDNALSLAQDEMNNWARRLASQNPDWNMGLPIKVLPFTIEVSGRTRQALLMLLAAVFLVLLIACTNVANLLLARGAGRTKELAIRSALGASQTRIARQVLTESFVLTSIAISAALVFAQWTVQFLVHRGPVGLPRLEEARLDPAVFMFAILISLLSTLLFGLWPALRAGQCDAQDALNSGGPEFRLHDSRGGSVLIVVECAIAIVLATSAALLLRSLREIHSVDLGFQPARILTVRVQPSRGASSSSQLDFVNQLCGRLNSLPGVERAGAIQGLFELGPAPVNSLRAVEGETGVTDPGRPLTWTTVSGDYFQAMGISLLAGRFFSSYDGPHAKLAAIIDQSMARRYWPSRDPLGRRFKGQDRRGASDDWITVIGVIRNTRRQGVEQEATPHVFLWNLQSEEPTSDWVIRTSAKPSTLASGVRAAVREIDPGAVISNLLPMEQTIEMQTAERRFQTWLLTLFAALALILAAIGIFGVMSHAAARRTHEIGVRMALGAGRGAILRMFLGQGIRVATAGLAAGIVIALAVTSVLKSLLYGVTPTDPSTFVFAGLLLLATAALATLAPAWRAARVDPMVALRQD